MSLLQQQLKKLPTPVQWEEHWARQAPSFLSLLQGRCHFHGQYGGESGLIHSHMCTLFYLLANKFYKKSLFTVRLPIQSKNSANPAQRLHCSSSTQANIRPAMHTQKKPLLLPNLVGLETEMREENVLVIRITDSNFFRPSTLPLLRDSYVRSVSRQFGNDGSLIIFVAACRKMAAFFLKKRIWAITKKQEMERYEIDNN